MERNRTDGDHRNEAITAWPGCAAPGSHKRARAYPSVPAVSSVITTTPTPMISEFAIHVRKRVCSSKYCTFASVGGALNHNGLFVSLYRSLFCLKVVMTIQ